jgi:drug/metabolite transporter (DMT)-like permease
MEQAAILFAFVAMIGWAFGDFFIQRTTRIVSTYATLFIIGAVGAVGLVPFVYAEIPGLTSSDFISLVVLSGIILVYGSVIFEALRRGKLSVVETVVAFELPLSVLLAVFAAGERITLLEFGFFLLIGLGILAAVTESAQHLRYHRNIFEKGVVLAFVGAFLSAVVNFYIGTFSQAMSPLIVIWATHAMLAIACGAFIKLRGEWRIVGRAFRRHPMTMAATGVLDNVAWVGYAFATSLMPISLTVAISESYIALAALLGFLLGKERLGSHQVFGAIVAITGAIGLSFVI